MMTKAKLNMLYGSLLVTTVSLFAFGEHFAAWAGGMLCGLSIGLVFIRSYNRIET